LFINSALEPRQYGSCSRHRHFHRRDHTLARRPQAAQSSPNYSELTLIVRSPDRPYAGIDMASTKTAGYRSTIEPELHGASFHTRKARSPWSEDGPKPQSLVRVKPDCLGMRMKWPNGGHVVMPLGRLNSTLTT
jgi:hypothetical protein